MVRRILFLSCIALVAACTQPEVPDQSAAEVNPHLCGIEGVTNVRVYQRDDRIYLYGGQDVSTHFDVTEFTLELSGLKDYGYHRETFQALIAPTYQPASAELEKYGLEEPVIWLKSDKGMLLYPYTLMTYHEVINETVDGEPVMIAYCFLADLAAVYNRHICGHEFTFAVSGYTYSDPQIWQGRDGFVLWDRDTESLWWPLIGRAVSGRMLKATLREFPGSWGLSTYGEVLATHPDAKVLEESQPWEAPVTWPSPDPFALNCRG